MHPTRITIYLAAAVEAVPAAAAVLAAASTMVASKNCSTAACSLLAHW